jgi:hypothetical protein
MSRPALSALGEPLIDYAEHFRRRVVQDAFAEATAVYWLRRAEQFDHALPRPDDYIGQATAVEIEAQHARLAALAVACRHRAAMSLIEGGPDDE